MKIQHCIRNRVVGTMVSVFLCGFLTACERSETMPLPSDNPVIAICQGATYVSLEELFAFCQGQCGQVADWEEKIAFVQGYIDYGNIFDKQHYPQLPYEKFVIWDEEHRRSMEIWTVTSNTSSIFDKIYQSQRFPQNKVFIQGTLSGWDRQLMSGCHKVVKLSLSDPNAISFQNEE